MDKLISKLLQHLRHRPGICTDTLEVHCHTQKKDSKTTPTPLRDESLRMTILHSIAVPNF